MTMLTAREVAVRLGIKLDSVYAYVSRGVLTARREAGSRRSLFDAEEVEVLARRGRPRRSTRPPVLDLVVETGLTTIVDQQLRYRGRDACAMARTVTFEQVAQWLWTGVDAAPGSAWEAIPIRLGDLRPPRDRIRAAVIAASALQPPGRELRPETVAATARALIATMVSAVPGPPAEPPPLVIGGTSPVRDSIAGRLSARLAPERATPDMVATLNAALVLLADHELASSTLAARVAASVRADPYSVVLAGLGPLAGPLHGGASALVHGIIADAVDRGPARALEAALAEHGQVPGFGHRLYPDGDPRAAVLLRLVAATRPDDRGVHAALALVGAVGRRTGALPNVDFALGALSHVARMPPTAGETVFTIARTAGWIAHAIEEYAEPPLRFRARTVPKGAVSDAHRGTAGQGMDDNQR